MLANWNVMKLHAIKNDVIEIRVTQGFAVALTYTGRF